RVSYIDRQVAQAQYGASNWSTAVEGVTPAFLQILDWQTAAGRALTAADGETAAMVCMIGQTVFRKLFAPDEDPVGATVLVERRHAIRPGEPDDFNVRNLSEIASTAEKTGRVIALLLAILASISLLVGGVGIMNILLVSVTERTREIGIRMAIGARRRHVLLQFLFEAVTLSIVGGVIGVLGGIGVSTLVKKLLNWPIVVSSASILLSFGVAG